MTREKYSLKAIVSADIYELLNHWARSVQGRLGDNLVGLYLTGSLTYGDFKVERTDIDLAAVVKKPLSEEQLSSIRSIHLDLENMFPMWKQRIECSYIPEEFLPCSSPPVMPRPWWGFGHLYETAPFGKEWIINVHFLNRCSIAIVGPEFSKLRNAVLQKELMDASTKDFYKEWLPKINDRDWLANDHYQSYLVLNLCRILCTSITGEARSKTDSSRWMMTRFPQWKSLVEAAQSWRYGDLMNRLEDARELIFFVGEELEKVQTSFTDSYEIRPLRSDLVLIQEIRKRAFQSIFNSFRTILGDAIFERACSRSDSEQAEYLDSICSDGSDREVYVIIQSEHVIGFVSLAFDKVSLIGEIDLNAVDPRQQGHGAGACSYKFALARLKELGATVVKVSTGGDTSHTAARRAYEKAGFRVGIPSVTYFQSI